MDMNIEISRKAEFAVLTIRRPEVLNALSQTLLRQLADGLDAVESSDARALLIIGEGPRAFSAGADVQELVDRTIEQRFAATRHGQSVFNRLEKLRQPSIALVNGYALGGGCELALAATFRLASPHAKFGLPEVKLGLVPGYGGTQRLPRLVGLTRALEIAMSGRSVPADEALRIGLVSEVVEGDLIDAGMRFARGFSGHGLLALKLIRDAMLRGIDMPLAEGLNVEADASTVSMLSADGIEGVKAFLEKRKPRVLDQ